MWSQINNNPLVKINAVRRNDSLSRNQKQIVIEMIMSVDNHTNTGFASYNTIMRGTGISINIVKRTLVELRELGILSVVTSGNNMGDGRATLHILHPTLLIPQEEITPVTPMPDMATNNRPF